LEAAARDGRDYAEFMLHSSEFKPGGSPTFADKRSIENLYRDLEVLFSTAAERFEGATLHGYYQQFSNHRQPRRESRRVPSIAYEETLQ
jgi:hypothetical protein